MIPTDAIQRALTLMTTDPTAGHRQLLDTLTPLVAIYMPPCAGWSDDRTFAEYHKRYQASWYVQWGAVYTRLHKWIVEQSARHPADQIERRARNVVLKGQRVSHEIHAIDHRGRPGIVASTEDRDSLPARDSRDTSPLPEMGELPGALCGDYHDPDQPNCHHRRTDQIEKTIDRRDLRPYAQTDLQRRVADLAAAGLDDTEIAGRLGYHDTRRVRQSLTLMRDRAKQTWPSAV